MKKILVLISIALTCSLTHGQVFSDKIVGKNKGEEIDSLKTASYPYLLPIGGEKVTNMGFDLPFSAGLSSQYVYQKSDIAIGDLSVGFNNGQMFELNEIVNFKNTTATTNGINIRPDFWVFPFLNVYGIFAQSTNKTNVEFGLNLPGNFSIDNGEMNWEWTEVAEFQTEAIFDATTYGIGVTPTVGVGGGFFALDMNWTWTDIPELEEPASIFVFGPRFGKSFKFGRPEQSLAVWVGAFRIKMGRETNGSLQIDDLFDDWDDKIENGLDKVSEGSEYVDNWWDGLSFQEKLDPRNIAKKGAADKALELAGGVLDAASRAESVQYGVSKRQENMWNFIVGGQYQLNKHWMIRSEFGFLGTRKQYIGGIQYRFGL